MAIATLTDLFGNKFDFADGIELTPSDQELIKKTTDTKEWTVLVMVPRATVQARQAYQMIKEYLVHVDPTVMIRADSKCVIWTSARPPLVVRPEFFAFTKKIGIVQQINPTHN